MNALRRVAMHPMNICTLLLSICACMATESVALEGSDGIRREIYNHFKELEEAIDDVVKMHSESDVFRRVDEYFSNDKAGSFDEYKRLVRVAIAKRRETERLLDWCFVEDGRGERYERLETRVRTEYAGTGVEEYFEKKHLGITLKVQRIKADLRGKYTCLKSLCGHEDNDEQHICT